MINQKAKKYLWILNFIVIWINCMVVAERDASKRISANIPGDFIIGALFSLHHPPSQKKNGQGNFLACGQIRELYGIQRAEVTFQTIDQINKDPMLLANITLGVEIRDSCWYAPVSLQQSIELIRDSLSPTAAAALSETCLSENKLPRKPTANTSKPFHQTLIGVIGPGSSSAALQTQNLLQLFSIPQIGYSTTSKDLSDKARYSTFLRVVPSDYYQAQVMVDVVKKFNWTYVSAVNTDENYGQSGIQAFRELAEKNGVCIAKEASILSNADENSFDDVLINLNVDKSANVVVCFCEGMTVRGLLVAMKRLKLEDRFLLIGSDGWADRADVVDQYERQALGSISIRIHSPYVNSFDPYYFALKPSTNYRNPWFNEFWEHKFNCSVNMNKTVLRPDERNSSKKSPCTGNENLKDRYKQEPKLSFIIKAIYTMAYALEKLQKDSCGGSVKGICPAMYPFNGTLFLNYLMNVSFSFGPDNDIVEFDSKGDPPGRYDIMNYQQLNNGSFEYIQVGKWNNGSLEFFKELQEFPTGHVESVCSKSCASGHYKNFHTGGQEKHCCWVCVKCERHHFLLNETHCIDCGYGYWPDSSQTNCLQIKVEFIQWVDIEALVAISSAILGFLLTGVVFIVFIRHNNTPVVKASTRELCYLILIGMIMSHASIFSILTKPSMWSCLFSRTLPGISFSMIYASLLVKTNRIARILAGSKKRFPTKKPKFMSAAAQLVITSLLISIEVSVAIAMLFIEPPDTEYQYPTRQRTVLACNTTRRGIIAPLGFIFLLIGLCTIYAWKTRNVPENFNEAKFIGFAMYCNTVIWIAFVPIYFGSESKIITMCLCISLSAMVTLVFLFLPKLYIIIIHPEKNIRALFTTSKTIRCHIGSNMASAISEKSSFSSRSYEYEKEYSIEPPIKPIDRKSSASQTSAELINSLINLSVVQKQLPSIKISSPTDTSKPSLTKKVSYQPMLVDDEINVNHCDEMTNKVNDNRKLISAATITITAPLRKPQHKIFPEQKVTTKTCDNLTFIDCNYYLNDNVNAQRDRSPIKLVNSQKNTVEQKSSNNQIYSIYNINNSSHQSPCISSTYNHHHNESRLRSSTITATPTANNILCTNCFEIEQRKFDGNSPIFTIESTLNTITDKNNHKQDSDACGNGHRNSIVDNNFNDKMRATISEESLSECSLSESLSCDCKLKSITIKLVKS